MMRLRLARSRPLPVASRTSGPPAGGRSLKSIGAVGRLARRIEPDLAWQRCIDRPVIRQGDRPEVGALRRYQPGTAAGRPAARRRSPPAMSAGSRRGHRRRSAAGTRRCRPGPRARHGAWRAGTAGPPRARRRAARHSCAGAQGHLAFDARQPPVGRATSRARRRREAPHGKAGRMRRPKSLTQRSAWSGSNRPRRGSSTAWTCRTISSRSRVSGSSWLDVIQVGRAVIESFRRRRQPRPQRGEEARVGRQASRSGSHSRSRRRQVAPDTGSIRATIWSSIADIRASSSRPSIRITPITGLCRGLDLRPGNG